jgi:hypothetical protein
MNKKRRNARKKHRKSVARVKAKRKVLMAKKKS